jgi:hypothetical protein
LTPLRASNGDLESAVEAFSQYGVKEFQNKRTFNNVKFAQTVEEVWKKNSHIQLDLPIHWQNPQGAAGAALNVRIGGVRVKKDTPLHARLALEVEDLLCRLFFKAEAIVAEPMVRGRSGASVLRVQPVFPAMGGGHSVVVKLGDADDIRKETENFEQYVQAFLGGARSTNIQTTRYTPLLGGISYSLLGAKDDFLDFATFYQRSEAPAIKNILEDLFRDTCAAWYASPGHLQIHELSAEYQSLLKLTPEILEDALRRGLKHIQGKERLRVESLGRDFANPLLAVAGRKLVRPTYFCTTHGDLNANNILVDVSGSTWLIDFLRTGTGHILRDFAKLDATVRFLLLQPQEASLQERLEMEAALLGVDRFSQVGSLATRLPTANRAVAKAFATSVCLRTLAAEQVLRNPKDDMSEYHIASLYFALDVIRYWDRPAVQREHALLAASLLCEHLGL